METQFVSQTCAFVRYESKLDERLDLIYANLFLIYKMP